jgi:hypothetical protein
MTPTRLEPAQPPCAADCGRPAEGRQARYCPPCRAQRKKKQPKWRWTQAADSVLRSSYVSHGRGVAREVARRLGFPRWVVSRRAGELGLTRPQQERLWTEAEVSFLLEHAGIRPVSWLARELSRPLSSVSSKMKRERIRMGIREGYTLRDLELCFGEDHHVIERWVREGKLHVGRRYGNGSERDPWHVTDGAVATFIIEHPTTFRLDRVDQTWFLGLVTDGRLMRRVLDAEGAA